MKWNFPAWFAVFQIFLFLEACTNGEKINTNGDESNSVVEISDFPIELKVKGTNVGPLSFFSNPTDIVFDQDHYLIVDDKKKEIFHLFNKKYELISSFGNIGEEPGSFSNKPQIINNNFIENKKLLLYQFPSEIIPIELKSTGDKYAESIISEKNKMTIKLPGIQYVANLEGNKYVGLGGMTEGKLSFFDLDSTKAMIYPFVPNTTPGPKTSEDKMFMYNGRIGVNTVEGKIVIANHYFNQLEIYDTKGQLLKEIRIGKLDSPFSKKPGERKFYFVNVDVTDKYIFAVYLGKKPSPGLDDLFMAKSEIHVFSWDGKPVAKLKLDRVIGAIAINPKKGIILSVDDFRNENQRLLEFSIPKVLL